MPRDIPIGRQWRAVDGPDGGSAFEQSERRIDKSLQSNGSRRLRGSDRRFSASCGRPGRPRRTAFGRPRMMSSTSLKVDQNAATWRSLVNSSQEGVRVRACQPVRPPISRVCQKAGSPARQSTPVQPIQQPLGQIPVCGRDSCRCAICVGELQNCLTSNAGNSQAQPLSGAWQMEPSFMTLMIETLLMETTSWANSRDLVPGRGVVNRQLDHIVARL